MLLLLGGPVLHACSTGGSDLLDCLRGKLEERFELRIEADRKSVPVPAELPAQPIPADTPPPPAPAADPTETIALATVGEPSPAPGFALPAPPLLPEGVPPDLRPPVQALSAETASPARLEPTLPLLPEPPADPLLPESLVATAPDRPDTASPSADPPQRLAAISPPLSIDAVEIDGRDCFIAGDGPEGATMRLYVDGVPAGVSPVEGGRWLIEGPDLLAEGRQVLRVEALDPVTGRQLAEAEIAFERPPATLPEAATVEEPPAAALPPIAPAVPADESASVTILHPSPGDSIVPLATGTLDPSSSVTLDRPPTTPALRAKLSVPTPKPDLPLLRAVPLGDPDAGRFFSGRALIRRGDTLWDIAHRYYGRGVHYRTIFRANRELIRRPSRIYPGQVFDLPLVYDD